MPDNSLPDEIISEILSPALKVADDVFSDTSNKSPFARYSESTSAYLVVCKSWLRVATPLLYNVVILRSKAQAKALARALTGNKDLGQFIRKLRVEGGFGPSMYDILKRAPNVSDIFLSFEIWTPDATDGLCKGLQLINPTQLILREAALPRKGPKNKMVANLVKAVTEAIPKWEKLTVFDCPYYYEEPRAISLLQALARAQRLQTLSVPSYPVVQWAYRVLKQCPLQAIHLKSPVWEWVLPITDDPVLQALLKYTTASSHILNDDENQSKDTAEPALIAPSLDPFFSPMSAASEELKNKIWSRVLYFAMRVPERAVKAARRSAEIRPKLAPLLVCKLFHELGLSHYYAHVLLQGYGLAECLDRVLLHRRPRIETIRGTTCVMPWRTFSSLVQVCGGSLHECSIQVLQMPGEEASSAIFEGLLELRKLSWSCRARLVGEEKVSSEALGKLEELQVVDTDETFLLMLSSIKLPSLRILKFAPAIRPQRMLIVHGSKLTELDIPLLLARDALEDGGVLHLCPNLTSLNLNFNFQKEPPSMNIFSSPASASLAKLTFQMSGWNKYTDKGLIAQWEEFFEAFPRTCASLSALREIHIPSFEWPTSEREISRSCWVRWAEYLLARNISLSDKAGKKWRKRLGRR